MVEGGRWGKKEKKRRSSEQGRVEEILILNINQYLMEGEAEAGRWEATSFHSRVLLHSHSSSTVNIIIPRQ